MAQPKNDLLKQPLKVVNVGLELFAQELAKQEVKVVHVEWKPPAGGDPEMMSILDQLL